MDNNNGLNITTVSIDRQHDKICILEQAINDISNNIVSITEMETIFSNYIDSIISNEEHNIQKYLYKIKSIIKDQKILNITLEISMSIAKNVPLLLRMD